MSPRRRGRGYVPLLRSYVDSVRVNVVSVGAEMLFCRLLAVSDDAGRFWGTPRRVLAKTLSARWEDGSVSEEDVAGWLDELAREGLIHRDEQHLQILRYYGSNRADRPAHVVFPPVEGAPPLMGPTGDTNGIPSGPPSSSSSSSSSTSTSTSSSRTRARDAAAGGNPVENQDGGNGMVSTDDESDEVREAWRMVGRISGGAAVERSVQAEILCWIKQRQDPERDTSALCAWARKKENPLGSLIHAVHHGYAKDHVPGKRRAGA